MSATALQDDGRYTIAEGHVRGAIMYAQQRKIPVRPGSPGVMRGEFSDRWYEDLGDRGLSPIGAVLLGRETESDSAVKAAAEILDVSPTWLAGVDDGFAKLPARQDAVDRRLYFDGYAYGLQLRKDFR